MDETGSVRSIRGLVSTLFRRRSTVMKPATTDAFKGGTGSVGLPTRSVPVNTMSLHRRRNAAVTALDQTWDDWLDVYAAGTDNLSGCERPLCFNGFGHMVPPDAVDERARIKVLERYGIEDKRVWRRLRPWLDAHLRPILARYAMGACSVSTINRSVQTVHFELGVGRELRVIARHLSIDGHALLSQGHFSLLDASSDWRTQLNPLVHGPPFVKFYLGVPLVVRDRVIGVIAVCDPYLRSRVPPGLLVALQALAAELCTKLEHRCPNRRARVEFGSPGLDDGDTSPPTPSSDTPSPTTAELYLGHGVLKALGGNNGNSGTAALRPLGGHAVLQPYQVVESLLKCRSFGQAIAKACRIVAHTLGIDLVYVVQIKRGSTKPTMNILGQYQRDPALETEHSGLDHHRGESLSGLSKTTHYTPNTDQHQNRGYPREQVVDHVKAPSKEDHNPMGHGEGARIAGLAIHEAALSSDFGILYSAGSLPHGSLEAGVLMPFRRENRRSTGYLMGAFAPHSREFSPGDLALMKKVVKALENILNCQAEQGLQD